MTDRSTTGSSRREFLQTTGRVAAATALAGVAIPKVYAAEENTIKVALIGCGGRGTGAAEQALSVNNGPIKLVAMADVFHDRLSNSFNELSRKNHLADKIDVPEDRRFVSFEGYKQAMDCLKPGDVAIFATPPAFRWVFFKYAVEKGLNVFMEKPVSVDGPSSRKMFAINEDAKKKNLKVGVGLMCRHCRARYELFDRIKNGELGDLTLLRAYRVTGETGSAFTGLAPKGMSELMWQIQHFHGFLWASGGAFSDFLIHNIDECCWMKDAWPIEAKGYGGRHYRGNNVDQNFDTYSVEYTFPDGGKLMLEGRGMNGCDDEFASYAHGTKNSAVISTSSHSPAKCRIYGGQRINHKDDLIWEFGRPEPNPYQMEWDDLIAAVRNNTPYNEVDRGVMASLVTSMGRMACHTGKTITFDEISNCEHEFAPNLEQLTFESPAPLQLNDSGKYPVPMPGLVNTREYAS
ncbi:MAG: Gfo/Idh/MocA family oxidoreductase [Pirellulales bacterium]|nr:Gfo/Idh/MocA family oxidoreductase [Pirellulales bacterium]